MALVTLYAISDVLSSGGLNTNRRLMVPSSGKRTEVALTAFLQHSTLQYETRQQRNARNSYTLRGHADSQNTTAAVTDGGFEMITARVHPVHLMNAD